MTCANHLNVKIMIDPLVGGILAKTAVDFLFPKVAEGALQAVGSDAYKGALKKLKGFFAYKFGDRPELDKGEANPEALTTLVTQSLESNEEMRRDLAQLVTEIQNYRLWILKPHHKFYKVMGVVP